MKKFFFLLILFTFSCKSSAEQPPSPPDPNAIYNDSAISVNGGHLQVLVDPKHHNICYYVSSHGYGETAPAISCLPMR